MTLIWGRAGHRARWLRQRQSPLGVGGEEAARLAVIARAGHMGPRTHAAQVNALIVRRIEEMEALTPQHGCGTILAQGKEDGAFPSTKETAHGHVAA